MTDRKRYATASLFAAALLAVFSFASKSAAAQSDSGKKLCVGCSVDGKATPRATDGHPNLSGFWGGTLALPVPGAAARAGGEGGNQGLQVIQRSADGSILFDFSTEYNSEERCNPLDEKCQQPNQPPYNEDYMKKVKQIAATEFQGTTALDPIQDCRASGVPRAGAPQYIMQSPQVIAFLYDAAPYSTYRMIYLDGRPHPDMKTYETTYFGDSIGHWEGDTLVVDTIGFNDDTWLGGGGPRGFVQFTSVHSEKEHAIERLTRDGDTLTYDVTIEDPAALTKPWVLATRRIRHAGPGMETPGEDALTENICTPTGHFVLPSAEDKDVKNKCGYRCDAPVVPTN